jgi:hypothetical protein
MGRNLDLSANYSDRSLRDFRQYLLTKDNTLKQAISAPSILLHTIEYLAISLDVIKFAVVESNTMKHKNF